MVADSLRNDGLEWIWPQHSEYSDKYTTFVFLYVIAFTAFSSALPIFCRVSPDQCNVRQVKYPIMKR